MNNIKKEERLKRESIAGKKEFYTSCAVGCLGICYLLSNIPNILTFVIPVVIIGGVLSIYSYLVK